jgi:hypothetical protein
MTGMTLGDLLRSGGKREDISWDRKHGFINLELPPNRLYERTPGVTAGPGAST